MRVHTHMTIGERPFHFVPRAIGPVQKVTEIMKTIHNTVQESSITQMCPNISSAFHRALPCELADQYFCLVQL